MSASASPSRPSRSRPVVESLRRGERVQRGYIGVALQDVDEGVAAALGIERNRGELIRSVTPGGPADRAGIRQGDVVITRRRPAGHARSVARLSGLAPADRRAHPARADPPGPAPQRHRRDRRAADRGGAGPAQRQRRARRRRRADARRQADATSNRPASARPSRASASRVQTLTPALARQLRITDANAARRSSSARVDPNSDAGQKGIQPGDVILSINQARDRDARGGGRGGRGGAAGAAQHRAAAGPPRQRPARLMSGSSWPARAPPRLRRRRRRAGRERRRRAAARKRARLRELTLRARRPRRR